MKKNKMTIFIVVLCLLGFFAGVQHQALSAGKISADSKDKKIVRDVKEQNNPYATAKISINIIPSVNKTFGYDILVEGKPLIHQPSIPAVPGNEGFKTRKKAKTVAEFVVKKIRKNEMPPTVTVEDMKKMNVL